MSATTRHGEREKIKRESNISTAQCTVHCQLDALSVTAAKAMSILLLQTDSPTTRLLHDFMPCRVRQSNVSSF